MTDAEIDEKAREMETLIARTHAGPLGEIARAFLRELRAARKAPRLTETEDAEPLRELEVRAAWMMQRAIARELAARHVVGGADLALQFAPAAIVAASYGELAGKTAAQRIDLFGAPDPLGEGT